MKNLKSLLLYSAAAVFALTSCDDDDKVTGPTGNNNKVIEVSGEITTDQTWTSDNGNIYVLDGRVTVTGGATLTIDAGTVIKANPGLGAIASALVISREGKIMANGTATQPIIFTTIADDIEPGMIKSPNMDAENNGLWGGVIILGKAHVSSSKSVIQIEGIPTTDVNGLYGGTEDGHSSGSFTYVSIRHGGTNIGAGNEINGLTLGGVGSGTVINNVEVVANQDDGIEWFGGTVSVTNALVWNCGDDAIDTDQDWTGTLDNFIVVNPGDRAFELDGPEGTNVTGMNHKIMNGTVYMGNGIELIDFDDNSNVDMSGIYFFGLKAGQITSGYRGFAGAGIGSVANFEVTLEGLTLADVLSSINATVVAKNQNTVGAAKNSNDFSWTWAAQSGAIGNVGL